MLLIESYLLHLHSKKLLTLKQNLLVLQLNIMFLWLPTETGYNIIHNWRTRHHYGSLTIVGVSFASVRK